MVKIQQLPNGQLVLTLPKKLAEFKGWKKGMKLMFKEHGPDTIIIQRELGGEE